MRKRTLSKLIRDEKGQALIIVMILMLLGGLIIVPMLAFMGTGIKVGKEVFEERMYGQYAADSGVEDALFKIKVDDPSLPPEWEGDWDADSYSTSFTYTIPDEVNGNDVEVTMQPIWVLDGLETPPPGMLPHGDMVIVGDTIGTIDDNGLYQVAINYDRSIGELFLMRIGAWLPAPYHFVPDSSNLEADSDADYYCVPVVEPFRGGETIIWQFSPPYPKFDTFPGEGDKRIVTFQFTPQGIPGSAFSWVRSKRGDIYLSWDVDIKIYQINSKATDVVSEKPVAVEAYATRSEMREMGASVSGDYRAIGGTLMIDADPWNDPPIRDVLLGENDATVSGIPEGAYLEAAYLFWTGWLEDIDEDIVFQDNCSNFDDWTPGDRWSIYTPGDDRFQGRGGGSDSAGTLTMDIEDTGVLPLGMYSGETVRVSWEQYESGSLGESDRFCFAFSGDGGGSWSEDIEAFHGNDPPSSFSYTIPDEYVTDFFKMRFFVDFSSGNEYVYINNIKIAETPETIADTLAFFEVNGTQVYFDSDGNPLVGGGEITASEYSVLENKPGTYSYACYLDVTELVELGLATTTPSTTNGNGTYTVGGVDGDTGDEWSYAAWSLIIVYSSPLTKGHQLYLYRDFIYSDVDCNVDFNGDGSPGGIISGFLAPEDIMDEDYAAHLTCFVGEGDDYYDGDSMIVNGTYLSDGKSTNDVWNSWSLGLTEDGIDIDTFTITYPTIKPGDTSAQVDLPTQTDSWNLVYIILSFRSDIKTSGAISYVYVGGE